MNLYAVSCKKGDEWAWMKLDIDSDFRGRTMDVDGLIIPIFGTKSQAEEAARVILSVERYSGGDKGWWVHEIQLPRLMAAPSADRPFPVVGGP